jgi:hypothetical protein
MYPVILNIIATYVFAFYLCYFGKLIKSIVLHSAHGGPLHPLQQPYNFLFNHPETTYALPILATVVGLFLILTKRSQKMALPFTVTSLSIGLALVAMYMMISVAYFLPISHG